MGSVGRVRSQCSRVEYVVLTGVNTPSEWMVVALRIISVSGDDPTAVGNQFGAAGFRKMHNVSSFGGEALA